MKISVVTISLNRGYEIEKTIQSVLAQTYKNLEYWVIDGGSSDDTLQILERYRKQLKFVSEKDNGIYHAMNKGINKAEGDYILFLNAGDYFFSDSSLQALIEDKILDADLIFGNLMMVEKNFCWEKHYPDKLTFDFFLKDFLPHPATLIKKSLFDLTGFYNENNKVVSDWEFFIHAVCKHNASYKYVNSLVSVFNTDGISSLNTDLSLQEKEEILNRHYPRFLEDYKALDKYKNELQHIKNSKLHSLTNRIMKNSIYRFLKERII